MFYEKPFPFYPQFSPTNDFSFYLLNFFGNSTAFFQLILYIDGVYILSLFDFLLNENALES